MSIYRIKVKHDHGTAFFTVVASSPDLARYMVQESEGCPPYAIKSVKTVKKIY